MAARSEEILSRDTASAGGGGREGERESLSSRLSLARVLTPLSRVGDTVSELSR